MKDSTPKGILDTNDEGLRRITHEQLKVFVKFTSPSCEICERLAPHFAQFAEQELFAPIRFLRLNSDENPVAQKIMKEKVAPFFVSYCQGHLLECDTLYLEEEVRAMLTRLRNFMPLKAT
ncbi:MULTISPECIES: thioredoxin domain-containing protein [Hymenobacter]|uniref:thioredoxin domain-containing protein n=1 Tax=Hymenobacter TaxID=89966 RepID=UPI001058A319|nr:MULTISPECIES: thioredoxin family protein [Hymenobacter]QIL74430.1 thioredoxin family protein [Hymenobacter sp. HDW8]